jgi:tetratricopeptide (TPR) repeat protein
MKAGSRIIATLMAVAITGSIIVKAGADEPKSARYYRQQAALAYKAKDYTLAAENFNKALALIPDHPTLFYNLGAISALQGKKAEAIAYLSKLTEMGLALHPEKDKDFDSIKESSEFKDVLKRFESNKAPVINSSTAFSIHEKGLITEGLAYDPVDETFFISSIHKRKILSVSKSGDVKTFATEADGLWSVLGMTVDTRRRVLWVTSSAFTQMENYKKEEDGSAAVFKFDLRTRRLIKKYLLSNATKKHALGDLTIQSNGDVYTTDSLSAAIYVVFGRPGFRIAARPRLLY